MDTRSNIIKGKIENVYLFYGEEDFKRRNFRNLLKAKVPYGDAINYSYFEGKDINYKELYEIATTLPFFAEKRLVIVENTGKFKQKTKKKDAEQSENAKEETSAESGSENNIEITESNAAALEEKEANNEKVLIDLLGHLPDTTCLAFFETQAAKTKKIFKEVAKKGVCEPCDKDNDADIKKWIQKGFNSFGLKCDLRTASFLIERVGNDYTTLSSEIKKISSYACGKDTVEIKDISAISTESIESKIFYMLDAMCDKNQELVLSKYFDMLQNKEQPLMILAMIRRQLRIMLQVAELANKGYDDKQISTVTKNPDFVIKKMKNYLRKHFRMRDIIKALDMINKTDKDIKSGNINMQLGVEIILIELSS